MTTSRKDDYHLPTQPEPSRCSLERLAGIRTRYARASMSQRRVAAAAGVSRSQVRRVLEGKPVSEKDLGALEQFFESTDSHVLRPAAGLPTSITDSSLSGVPPAVIRDVERISLLVLAAEKGVSSREIARYAAVSPSTMSRARKGEIDVPPKAWPLVPQFPYDPKVPPWQAEPAWSLKVMEDAFAVGPDCRLSPVEVLLDAYLGRERPSRGVEPKGSTQVAREGRRPSYLSLDKVVLGMELNPSTSLPPLLDLEPGQRAILPLQDGLPVLAIYRRKEWTSRVTAYRKKWYISDDDNRGGRGRHRALATLEIGPRYRTCSPVRLRVNGRALQRGLGDHLVAMLVGGVARSVVVREVDVALDIDQPFASTIFFEDGKSVGRRVDRFMGNALSYYAVNYLRIRPPTAPMHVAVYDKEGERRLARSQRRGWCFPVGLDQDLPLRVEVRLKLLQAAVGISSIEELEARLSEYFAPLRLIDLRSPAVQALPRGALLTLSWVQRHGLTRSAPTLKRLERNRERQRLDDEEYDARKAKRTVESTRGERRSVGWQVFLDAGDIVLEALLQRHDRRTAERMAREWYQSTVELLRALSARTPRLDEAVSRQGGRVGEQLRSLAALASNAGDLSGRGWCSPEATSA